MALPAPPRHLWGTALTAGLMAVLGVALASVATAQARGDGDKGKPQPYADPADVISADLTFLRLAREKGLASAVKATAAPTAMIVSSFDPQPIPSSPNPWPPAPKPTTLANFLAHDATTYGTPQWPVQQVWMSCDGTVAVTAGDPDHTTSITVWQRQKKGGYKWVAHIDGLISGLRPPSPAPAKLASSTDVADAEMIGASVADCPARGRHGATPSPAVAVADTANTPVAASGDLGGAAPDGTLTWIYGAQLTAFSLRLMRYGALQGAFSAVGRTGLPIPHPVLPVTPR